MVIKKDLFISLFDFFILIEKVLLNEFGNMQRVRYFENGTAKVLIHGPKLNIKFRISKDQENCNKLRNLLDIINN